MINIIKPYSLTLAIIAILVHNFLLTVSLIPANPLSIRYAHKALDYTDHLSPQGWFFFTPVPTKSHMVVFRKQGDTEWQNPFLKAITNHRRNPLGFDEKIAYIHMDFVKDLAIFYEKFLESGEGVAEEQLLKDLVGKQLNNFLRYYSSSNDSIEWIFLEYEVPPFSERAYNTQLNENVLMRGLVTL